MNFIVWILMGALAGWIASIIMGSNARQGWLGNIIVGIVGAFLGGLIMSMFGQPGVQGFDLYSVLVAIGGAVVTLFLYRMLTGGRSDAV